jgi:hypothetical protein
VHRYSFGKIEKSLDFWIVPDKGVKRQKAKKENKKTGSASS